MAALNGAATAEMRAIARSAAPDFYVAHLLLPRSIRPQLLALTAYYAELDAIPFKVSEPLLGEIRLQWWRDTFQAAATTTNHAGPDDVTVDTNNAGAGTGTGEQTGNMPPIVQALTAPLQAGTIAPAHLCAMADGRQFDLSGDRMANEEDLQAYLSKTFGTPLAITARLCAAQVQISRGSAGKADPAGNDALMGQIDSAAHWCGVAYGLATIAANPRRWAALGTDPFAPFADDPHLTVPAAFESAHTNARRALADLVKSRAGAAVRPAFLPVTLGRPLLSRAVSLGDAFLTRSIAISPMQRVLTLARHRLYWRL